MKSQSLLILAFFCPLILSRCPNPASEFPTGQVITLLEIPGVVRPVSGVAPVTAPIETDQYTGTIEWSPSGNPFHHDTVYTAVIVLTAKQGWTLSGIEANAFKVFGASSTNSANKGTVSAVFPATSSLLDYDSAYIGILRYVPAGRFQRDADINNISTISTAFRIGQYEITRAQFQAIMGADPGNNSDSKGINDPIQMVNWYHAIAFCNKLSLAEGLTPVYAVSGVDFATLSYSHIPTSDFRPSQNAIWDAATATWTNNGYRLPTEMEWMWAAMGAPTDGQHGGTDTSGYLKAFAGSTGSNNIDDYVWYLSNSGGTTHPVGSKTNGANELGLFDMSGNVWEICWDWHDAIPAGMLTDYRGAYSGRFRVNRSGSWKGDASYCVLTFRLNTFLYIRSGYFGFRVVRP